MLPMLKQNPWIVVALDAADALGVARHEAVHYLKQFGFFSEKEWFNLTRAARDNDWIKKFRIDERSPDLDMPSKLEEAIAEGYRNWARGEEVPSHLHPIFERLKELFESLKSQLKELLGREPTWEELFQKMDTGEVGARKPRGHPGGAFLEPSAMDEQAAPKAANDIDALQRKHAPTYEAAVKAQTIERYINKDTERGDTQYWRKIAADEGHNVFDKPNSIAAARAHSRDGKTTMVIAGDGSRTVFHDGVKVVRERRSFEPSMMEGEEPEKIVSATATINNRVFTGANHVEAMEKARKELGSDEVANAYSKLISSGEQRDAAGFMTSSGRVVSRAEATKIAEAAKQGTATHPTGTLKAEDIKPATDLEPKFSEGEAPMFDKAAAVGMTADQFKRYMKLMDQRHTEDLAAAKARAEAEQGKRLTKEWKDNEKQVRQDVSESIRNRPDVAADLFFGAGELYGSKIDGRFKIGEKYLSPEQKAKLPRSYVSKSGINPDDFAGEFGYGSGGAMIDRLGEYNEAKLQAGMSAKDYVKRVTDLETQRQMEIKYGSLEKSILDEAKDQAISETQLNLLHEEVLALGIKAGGEFSITKDELKRWVKGEFDQTPLKSIDTDKFLASAGKAGKAAEMGLLKENYAEAFRAKQQQYLAMQMATEAKKLEKEMASFDKLAKRLSARDQPSLDPSYVPYIHQILFQVGRQVKRSVQDLQSALAYQGKTLEEFVDFKQQHDLREIPVAEFLLDPAFKKEFESLTAEEFRAVHDSIKSLNANARDELKIYKAGEAADLADIKSQMIDQLRTFKEKFYDAKGGRWLLGVVPPKVASIIRTYGAAHLQMEALFNRWDRGDPRGVFSQYVMRDLAAAANSEAALEKKYSRILKDIPSPKDLKKQVDNPIFKDPVSMAGGAEGYLMSFTRENMLAILLDAGNESNLVKRAKGYGLHRAQVTDWLNTHATKEDWDWTQKIWNTFDEIKKESDVMYRSISGVEPEAIDIKPIQTPHGTYPGGYYPVIFHPEFEGTSRKLMGGDALEQENFHRAVTPAGYTKKRTAYSAPMSFDLDMLPVRMRQMLHDIAMRPAIINAGKIFYDHDVRNMITKHYGAEYREMLIPYLKDVANSANFRDDASRRFTNLSEFIRQNMVSTLIGLNPGTVMKHGPTAAINSLTEVGIANFSKAVTGLMSINEQTGESNWKFAMETSEELQRRHRNYSETLSGAMQSMAPTSRYESMRENLIKFSATPVAISDLLSAVPTCLAKDKPEMADHGVHGDAVYEADRAVRRAHGSVAITNRAGVMRTGPMGSWLASVYGFFSHIVNRQFELMWRSGDAFDMVKEGDYKGAMAEVPKLTTMLFSYVILPALIEEMVTPLASDDKESWGKKAAKGLAYTLGASWIGVRDLASALLRGQDPAIGLFSTGAKTITDMGRDISKDRPLSKDHAGRVIQHGATLMGTLFGLTNAQMGKTARFGYDVSTGKERPKGPWGWMVGARFGTTEKHSKTFDEWLRHH